MHDCELGMLCFLRSTASAVRNRSKASGERLCKGGQRERDSASEAIGDGTCIIVTTTVSARVRLKVFTRVWHNMYCRFSANFTLRTFLVTSPPPWCRQLKSRGFRESGKCGRISLWSVTEKHRERGFV